MAPNDLHSTTRGKKPQHDPEPLLRNINARCFANHIIQSINSGKHSFSPPN